MQVYQEEDEYPDSRPTMQRSVESTRVHEGEHYSGEEDHDQEDGMDIE